MLFNSMTHEQSYHNLNIKDIIYNVRKLYKNIVYGEIYMYFKSILEEIDFKLIQVLHGCLQIMLWSMASAKKIIRNLYFIYKI